MSFSVFDVTCEWADLAGLELNAEAEVPSTSPARETTISASETEAKIEPR